jgi:Uma2 family endonuclease
MYDLPSENPEEPGLPDVRASESKDFYHYLQPQLLSATLRLSKYAADQVFSVGDMNLYYDSRHPQWYKRPDWFAVAGVPRLYEEKDMRLSYVVWQEGVNPFVVVELLSPGTEREDLGQTERGQSGIPTKWEVYEQILRVPYYILFDRYTNTIQAFRLVGGHYQPIEQADQQIPISEWHISLKPWTGDFQGVYRTWLRWYDADDQLILTDAERLAQAEDEAKAAQEKSQDAEQRAEALAQRLRDLGIEP